MIRVLQVIRVILFAGFSFVFGEMCREGGYCPSWILSQFCFPGERIQGLERFRENDPATQLEIPVVFVCFVGSVLVPER